MPQLELLKYANKLGVKVLEQYKSNNKYKNSGNFIGDIIQNS
jgi:hypothetical protein